MEPRTWTAENRLELARLVGRGLYPDEIVATLEHKGQKVSIRSVRWACDRYGIQVPKLPRRLKPAAPKPTALNPALIRGAWTKQEVATLRRLAEAGLSGNQIHKEMPQRSRNSIVGACGRYRIKLRGQPWGSAKSIPTGQSRGYTALQVVRAVEDLGDKQCRWPIGDLADPDFHFCPSTQALKSSYCTLHHSMQFRKEPTEWPNGTSSKPGSRALAAPPTRSTTRPPASTARHTTPGMRKLPASGTTSRAAIAQ